MHNGDLAQAGEGFAAVVKQAPAFAEGFLDLGLVREEQGRHDEAITALQKALHLKPGLKGANLFLGIAEYRMSRLDAALVALRNETTLSPKDANAAADRHQDAIAEYQAAIKLAPNQPRLHEDLGRELRIAGKMEEAEVAFRKELEIDPDNVTARYKLGVLLTEKGDAAQGKQLIEAALRVRPGLRNADYNLGRAEMLLGNDSVAVEDFQRATKADSDADVLEQSWYQLGTVLRRMHRQQEAQQAFAMFQKLKDAEAEDLQTALAKYKNKQATDAPAPPSPPQNPY